MPLFIATVGDSNFFEECSGPGEHFRKESQPWDGTSERAYGGGGEAGGLSLGRGMGLQLFVRSQDQTNTLPLKTQESVGPL